jgi:hypothetical protein
MFLSNKYKIQYDNLYTPYTRNNRPILDDDDILVNGDDNISVNGHGDISELFGRITSLPHGKLENDSYPTTTIPTTTIDNAIISPRAESKSNQPLGIQQQKSSKGISNFYGNVPELQTNQTTLPTSESKVTPRFGERQGLSSTNFPFSFGTSRYSPKNDAKSSQISTHQTKQELIKTLEKHVQNLQQQTENSNKTPLGKKNARSLRRISIPKKNNTTDALHGGSNIQIPANIQPFVDSGNYNIFFNLHG